MCQVPEKGPRKGKVRAARAEKACGTLVANQELSLEMPCHAATAGKGKSNKGKGNKSETGSECVGLLCGLLRHLGEARIQRRQLLSHLVR